MPMVVPAVEGIDLFKIAGRSISGWIPSLKTGTASHIWQPFCSQLEERLLLWLEYHPQVVSYARGDIGTPFATAYRLPTQKTHHLRLATLLKTNPMTTCPMSWGRSRMESCSSPKRVWRMTNGKIVTSPKRRQRAAWHAFNEASTGLVRSGHSQDFATTIWSSCMPGVRAFPPLPRLLSPCRPYQ